MRIVMTGAHGTVGSVLRQHLTAAGHEVFVWDRQALPIDQYQPMEHWLRSTDPAVLFHLAIGSQSTGRPNESWLVNYEWPSELAWICRTLEIKLIHASTVMVFSNAASGPFTSASIPDADAGYGYEKRMAEARVRAQNPQASIVRLGWQIGQAPGSNNMLDFFQRQMDEHGQISASTRWYPACSLLDDTAAALVRLITLEPDIYLLDSNRRWTFYEIATALNELHGSPWKVVPSTDFVYDQRMIDQRVVLPALSERLPGLPA